MHRVLPDSHPLIITMNILRFNYVVALSTYILLASVKKSILGRHFRQFSTPGEPGGSHLYCFLSLSLLYFDLQNKTAWNISEHDA